MTLVDSSVWIDYFRGTSTLQVARLDALLASEPVAIGDLMLAEVLQGFASDHDFNEVCRLLTGLTVVPIGGADIAVQAARNYRSLRALGVTVRKTIDCLIATCCIEGGYALLHDDRDFDAFERHLGLRVA